MYDHIGLKVKDIDASARFYEAALAPLGLVRDGTGFGPKGAPALWLYEGGHAKSGTHVAFAAKTRAAVDTFHAAGVKAGGKENGAQWRGSGERDGVRERLGRGSATLWGFRFLIHIA